MICFFLSTFSVYIYLQKYKDLDGEVIRKDGILLLREMAAEVKNFMDFKMNAVMVSGETINDLLMFTSHLNNANYLNKRKRGENVLGVQWICRPEYECKG